MSDLLKKDEKLTTPQLLEKLRQKYIGQSGQWAFITQVRNGTGWNSVTRTADAMAMGMWPSTGLKLIGFELKVSRSDWLHEVKNPDKHQEMKQFCDEWYLVIPDMSIIKDGEVPEDWGIMAATGRGKMIVVERKASKLEPVHVDRLFLASLFRNITEKMIPYEMHQSALKQTEKYATENALRVNKTKFEQAIETERKIKEFEDATGIKFEDWRRDHLALAEIVKNAEAGKYDNVLKKMEQLRETSERITKFIDGEIEEYRI